MEKPTNRPVVEFKLASVRASVWQNHNDDGETWFKVTISRMLPAGNDRRDTTNFRRDDLPLVAKAADLAYAYIWDRERQLLSRQSEEVASEEF